VIDLPLEYSTHVLDKNDSGLISIQQIAKDPLLGYYLVAPSLLHTNNTKVITNNLVEKFGSTDHVSIQKQIRHALIKYYENESAFNLSKCQEIKGCSIWFRSESSLTPTLSVIGSVPKSTGISIFNGENDSQTPVQQAFLLQQRLTEVNHPDHTLITYPNLGYFFYHSPQWFSEPGPIEPHVLADLYSWLAAHFGFTNHVTDAQLAATPSSNSTAK